MKPEEIRSLRLGTMGLVLAVVICVLTLPMTRLAIGGTIGLSLAVIATVFIGKKMPVGQPRARMPVKLETRSQT
jgi:hypothetical protein